MEVFLELGDATPALAAPFRAALGPDAEVIEQAPAIAWLPLAVNVRATHAVMAMLPAGEAEAFFRALMLQGFETPFLKPVVTLAIGLFGLDVGSFVKMVPRGWTQIFADAGAPAHVDRGSRWATLDMVDLHPSLADDDGRWATSVAWSMGSLIAMAKTSGSVRVTQLDPPARRFRLAFEWT